MPEEFGKWGSVYRQFRRWPLAGLWQTILEVMNESNVVPDSLQMIDNTITRAHHCAAGVKGGLKKKTLAVLKVALSPGQTSDYLGYDAIMDADLAPPKVLLADTACDSDANRDDVEARRGTTVIPARKTIRARNLSLATSIPCEISLSDASTS